MHNPVLLPDDIARFAQLVRLRGLSEKIKPENRLQIAGRIALFHEVISRGLQLLLEEETNAIEPSAKKTIRE